jgi:hypothetical protein
VFEEVHGWGKAVRGRSEKVIVEIKRCMGTATKRSITSRKGHLK